MKCSSAYFSNTDCEYFPCHEHGFDGFNCLFCFCPMYSMECLGEPLYVDLNGRLVKDCSKCAYPHIPGNYMDIMRLLSALAVHGSV